MRVLYLIDSLAVGGAERSLAALAPHLLANGVVLDVAVLHDRGGLQQEIEAAGVRVNSLAGRGGRAGWAWRAADLVRRVQPDLVHTTLFEADVAGRLAATINNVPVTSSLVSETYAASHLAQPGLSRWKVRGAQALDAATARLTRRMHAVSMSVADTMAQNLRYPRSRIDVIPRGRDDSRLGRRTQQRRDRVRARLGVHDSALLVLGAARHEYPKGLDLLIDSFPVVRARVPGAHLVIAGRDGADSSRLRAEIARRRLAPEVELLGERDDVADLLCAADVFVLPSRREGFPGVLVEALALRAPIVATDLPQVREVVGDCAVLVPSESPDQLAAALLRTLAGPEEAAARALAGRNRFEQCFTIERVAAEMLEMYGRILRARVA